MVIIYLIFSKKDPIWVEHYRGIFLLDGMYKVLSLAILNRIEKYVLDIIRQYQCGFIKGRLTTDHIFKLKKLLCPCETWSTTKRNKNKLLTFEKKVLRKINEQIKNAITSDFERRKTVDLDQIHNKSNIKIILCAK